jgi:hypothetical protein
MSKKIIIVQGLSHKKKKSHGESKQEKEWKNDSFYKQNLPLLLDK